MWALVVLVSMVAAMGAYMVSQEARTAPVAVAMDDQLARNLALYRAIVVEHVRTHATAPGTVPDAALAFPGWYQRHSAWNNLVQADGTIVVYATQGMPATLPVRIAQLSQGSVLAGEARHRANGDTYLHSPWHGDTGLALPALDTGTVVWLARLE